MEEKEKLDQDAQKAESGPEGRDEVAHDPDRWMQAVEKLRKEKEEYYDLLLRKQAEFENYRKRTVKEKDETRVTALVELARELLPVMDGCEKALQNMEKCPADPALEAYRAGYGLLCKQLQAALEKFQVTSLATVGARFDPHLHEAVVREVSEEREEGEILEEYRKGYKIGARLVRPAQVKVAVRPREVVCPDSCPQTAPSC